MNDTLIEQIQADAAALDIKITAQEIALYLSEKKVPPEHLEAIKRFIAFLKKISEIKQSAHYCSTAVFHRKSQVHSKTLISAE